MLITAPSSVLTTAPSSSPQVRELKVLLRARHASAHHGALLFRTGTSINPLLRAAYLSRAGYNVTLLLPWLELEDQKTLFPPGMR